MISKLHCGIADLANAFGMLCVRFGGRNQAPDGQPLTAYSTRRIYRTSGQLSGQRCWNPLLIVNTHKLVKRGGRYRGCVRRQQFHLKTGALWCVCALIWTTEYFSTD